MPRVELPELHEGRDGKRELFKLVNMTQRRFNVTGAQGTTTDSAATLLPPGDGDYFHVSGVVAIDYIALAGTADGDPLELYFSNGLTLNHGSATPGADAYALKLAGSINAVMAAGGKMRLRRDPILGLWVEMWRGAA